LGSQTNHAVLKKKVFISC